jgi:hypothetical protein
MIIMDDIIDIAKARFGFRESQAKAQKGKETKWQIAFMQSLCVLLRLLKVSSQMRFPMGAVPNLSS